MAPSLRAQLITARGAAAGSVDAASVPRAVARSPRRPLRRPDLIPEMHLSICPPLQQARRLVYYDRRCPEHQLILAHLVPELREFEIHPCEDNVQLLVILRLILFAIRDTVLVHLLGGGTMEILR